MGIPRFHYAITFEKLHMGLVDTMFRYNNRHHKGRYIANLAGNQEEVRMIGLVVKGLRVRHQTKDATRRITYAGYVVNRAVGVERKLPLHIACFRSASTYLNAFLLDA